MERSDREPLLSEGCFSKHADISKTTFTSKADFCPRTPLAALELACHQDSTAEYRLGECLKYHQINNSVFFAKTANIRTQREKEHGFGEPFFPYLVHITKPFMDCFNKEYILCIQQQTFQTKSTLPNTKALPNLNIAIGIQPRIEDM